MSDAALKLQAHKSPTAALCGSLHFDLCWMVQSLGGRRFAYRMLRSVSIGIALSQAVLCWLSDSSHEGQYVIAHWMTTTLLYTLAMATLASLVLVSGFVDEKTLRFISESLQRSARAPNRIEVLQTQAVALWLGGLVGLPIVVVSLVAIARAPDALLATRLSVLSLLSLAVAEAFGLFVAITVHLARRVKALSPRAVILAAVLGPELCRLFAPELPTLRTTIASIPPVLLRCSL